MHIYACMCDSLCLTLCNPKDCSPPGSSVHGIFPGKNNGVGCIPTPGDLPDPAIKPMSPAFPALAGGFFTTEPPAKPINVYLYPQIGNVCVYLKLSQINGNCRCL